MYQNINRKNKENSQPNSRIGQEINAENKNLSLFTGLGNEALNQLTNNPEDNSGSGNQNQPTGNKTKFAQFMSNLNNQPGQKEAVDFMNDLINPEEFQKNEEKGEDAPKSKKTASKKQKRSK